MNINPVSFGKAIPVANCNIINKSTNQAEKATVYEYDCLDEHEDVDEILALPDIFYYKNIIADKMQYKHEKAVNWHMTPNSHFYSLKNEQGRTLSVLYTYDSLNSNGAETVVVDRLQSDTTSPYKYAGQAILAALCRIREKDAPESIVIKTAANKAVPFYTDKCGFYMVYNHELELPQSDYAGFIQQTEQKTKGKINTIV